MSKRNWKHINESLVRRGELLLNLGLLKGWSNELQEMNKGKEGARFRYPDSFIRLLLFMHFYLHLPYRQLEGFIKALSKYINGLKAPDHSSIQWRAERLKIRLDNAIVKSNEDLVIALDASGIKVTNRGDWIRHKWKVRRGYLKIHIAVDVKRKKILAMEVTDEGVGDGSMLKTLVDETSSKARVVKAIGDGAYDSRHNFHYLANKHIEPIIRVRRNSSRKARGCMARKLVVMEYLSDPEGWKNRHGYSKRWMAESVFSSFKRTFGEYVSARKADNMAKELMVKASLYNIFIGLTANI
ncbi:MAG: IS5 family transposase [Halobacteria archaeon]